MKFLKRLAAVVSFSLALPGAAMAQDAAIALEGDVMVEKTVTEADGTTTTVLEKPGTIVPGDRLVFGTDYVNNSAEVVENFTVTNPLPSAVRLAPEADADLVVSVDGGSEWGALSALTVTGEDGTQRAATHSDVTHIRWTLATVQPGEEGRLEYPAVIR